MNQRYLISHVIRFSYTFASLFVFAFAMPEFKRKSESGSAYQASRRDSSPPSSPRKKDFTPNMVFVPSTLLYRWPSPSMLWAQETWIAW